MKLLGQRFVAWDYDRRVAEVEVRIAVMSGCPALGIPITETMGEFVRRKGGFGHQGLSATEPMATKTS